MTERAKKRKNSIQLLLTGLKSAVFIWFILMLTKTSCREENYPPVANLEVSPLSGEVPLEVRMKLTGFDENGPKDIRWYEINYNSGRIKKSSPIDTLVKLEYSGIVNVTGKVTDYGNKTGETEKIQVEVLGKPFIEHFVSLVNDAEIKYEATLYRVPEADLTIEKDGNQIFSKKINDTSPQGNDYEKIFTYSGEGITKGNYKFKLKAGELEKEVTATIPEYAPGIKPMNPINFSEFMDTVFTFTNLYDKNPEDNPVIIYNVLPLDSKTTTLLLADNKVKILGQKECTGAYSIKLFLRNIKGDLGEAVVNGNIIDDPKIVINPFRATNLNGKIWDSFQTRQERDNYLQQKLNEDWTNTIGYNPNPRWDCSESSRQLKINFHGFPGVKGYYGDDLDSIYFYHGTFKDNGKYGLPVYSVMVNFDDHEMNAILTGNNAELFEDWNFIEPQFDQINIQPGQAYMPRNCTLEIWYTFVNKSDSLLDAIPILIFQITDGTPTLIWKNPYDGINFKTQR